MQKRWSWGLQLDDMLNVAPGLTEGCGVVWLFVLQIWLDQADGQVLSEGEEVTFMDWGNAFIRVSLSKLSSLHLTAWTCASRCPAGAELWTGQSPGGCGKKSVLTISPCMLSGVSVA
jgi:hypothetical protein